MSQATNNFKVGLFTLAGLVILIIGVLAFGARSYLKPTSLFETYVAGDVTGLTVGSPVELRGVQVGKVTRIGFSWIDYQLTQPSYIVVDFEVQDEVSSAPPGESHWDQLKLEVEKGLRARLKSKGITGTSILSLEYLDPANNPAVQVPWTPRHIYIPAAPGQFVEILASIEKSLRNVEQIDFGDIDRLVHDDLKSAGRVLDKAGQVDFQSLSTNASGLLTELRESNAKLKSVIEDTDDAVKKIKLEKLAADLDGLVAQLQNTVAGLQPGLANIDFEAVNQTLANAQRTIRDMDDVLTELKRYPSGFIFGSPPPAVKEVRPPTKK
jgi:phospholipid/cholesterol/gamma-HCH transport system substrate-binding protein